MNDFPIDSWLTEMKDAVDRIARLGQAFLETHRRASDKAAANADRWHLAQRLDEERQALLDLLDCAGRVIRSIVECRRAVHAGTASNADLHQGLTDCADVIEETLPRIEESFVTSRHAALDLLRWAERAGKIEESTLPADYRASYARLISHAPVIKPLTETFQEDLLRLKEGERLHPVAQRLISVLSRYNAVMETARSFVRSVTEPPLELAFHETASFLEDVKALSREQLAAAATELNDCCQLLLYDVPEFNRRVRQVRPRLAAGIDASMVVLGVSGGFQVIFTVDEDPVFEQLSITLLRIVPEQQIEAATDDLARALYGHFSSE